jgi:hypothetical protein
LSLVDGRNDVKLASMKNLVYLSYGRGPHEQENAFSMLSAYHWLGVGRPDIRIVVYTDRPESFEALGVAMVELDAKTAEEWAGPAGFGHRRKIMAVRDAMQRFDGPTALLDGDTYFRRSPHWLFGRIAPGRSVMHLREGRVKSLPGGPHAELSSLLQSGPALTDLAGNVLSLSAATVMWNSGVIGVHPADRHVLDEAIHLTDQLCSRSKLHTLEQFALGVSLGRQTSLRETGDVVFHYWEGSFRIPFRQRLPQVLERYASLPLSERARLSYADRPRSSIRRRCRSAYNRLLRSAGLLPPIVRSSE